ncbi:uncharacterized protein CC84DRAFT_1168360 [Paraphaeosphaeria sporulosa]|uniref:Uncharacterized protein n=1 Tax=Paraphaeosphaeria sporulosa TaxID=1460663 RepID=A0A177C3K9_9PLEO|nr:uncharacterized protein CC84DRAFT_1168360 [Paraphaeosphaeria sporulosa]OAG01250.1 hypothetical protein CC84DRAFT_1168360 [Paraphaeosphaeria sporulosa]
MLFRGSAPGDQRAHPNGRCLGSDDSTDLCRCCFGACDSDAGQGLKVAMGSVCVSRRGVSDGEAAIPPARSNTDDRRRGSRSGPSRLAGKTGK